MSRRRHRVAVLCLAVLAPLLAGPSSEGTPRDGSGKTRTLPVFTTGDTDGYMAASSCRNGSTSRTEKLHYPRLVARFRQIARASRQSGERLAPLALHAGDFAFPGPIGRYLLTRGVDGAAQLAELLGAIPYASVSIGNRELGLRPVERTAFADGARRAELPLSAANVVCNSQGGAEALCEAVGTGPDGEPWQIVRRGETEIAVVSLVDPAVRADVATSRLTGLDVLAPGDVLSRTLERIDEEVSADLVVVQYHGNSATEVGTPIRLAREVRGIDLMVTNLPLGGETPPDDGAPAGSTTVPETETRVVNAGLGPAAGTRIDATLAGRGQEVRIVDLEAVHVDATETEPAEDVARTHRDVLQQLCRDWGRPIEGSPELAEPMDRGDFTDFVLRAVRRRTGAEVAVANTGAFVASDTFPIEGHITYADVYTTLPYGNNVVVGSVPGSVLKNVADRLGKSAVAAGLTKSGVDASVNGRPLDETRTYRVALNSFVAEGGDGLLEPETISGPRKYRAEWASDLPTVAEVVIDTLEKRAFHKSWQPDAGLTTTSAFADLHRRFLWRLFGSVNASLTQVAVDNPDRNGEPAYEQSQLNVQSAAQINLESDLQANADSRNHGWDNRLNLQYATARIDAGGSSEETKDLVRARSVYKYAGIRADLDDAWWGPMPSTELQVESEFTTDDDPRKFELTGIVGSTFQLAPPFEFKLGVDVRRDLSLPGGEFAYGLATAYRLERLDAADIFGSPVEIESELEYFFNIAQPSQTRIQELRTTSRLFYSVLGTFDVTATFSAFLLRHSDVGDFGTNTELTVGLNYRWDRAIQSF